MSDQNTRLLAANDALALFAFDTWLEMKGNRVVVCWRNWNSLKVTRRQWACRGQDFYPVWNRLWGHGGTSSTALSQLIRWVQDKPVLPMGTWRHWIGPVCLLGRERGPRILDLLKAAEYPEHAYCVLCGDRIDGGIDWWHLKNISGPCCSWNSGCRQKVNQ
jgi:hypothetical protein